MDLTITSQRYKKKKQKEAEIKENEAKEEEDIVNKLKLAFDNIFVNCSEYIAEEQERKTQRYDMGDSVISVNQASQGNLFSNNPKFTFPPLIASNEFKSMNADSMQ